MIKTASAKQIVNRLVLWLSFVVFSSPGFSQENAHYSFTLQEAVDFALDSSYSAINSRRDMAKALKQKWETTARGLPQIDGNIAYNYNIIQPTTLIPAEFVNGEPGTYIPLKFGTTQSAQAVATLNQLIFDGSYLVGLKAAKAFLEYSENTNEKTRLEIRKGVINAYGSVLMAEELIAIFEKNTENLERNHRETLRIFENGLTEEESVEQLEITLLDMKIQLQNAERSLRLARQMFNLALGLDVDTPVLLTENLETLTEKNISLELLEKPLRLEENVDFKIAENLVTQRNLEMQLEKSRFMPNLSAFVNYGTMANSDDFSFFQKHQKWYQSSIFGVSLNIPVFSSGMRRAAAQQARLAYEQAKTDFEEAAQQIRLQVTTARNDYIFAIDRFENSKLNLSLAERIEHKNQIKFKEGLASAFDLRQAQTQLYSAQQTYFETMLQVINEKANLETVLNTPMLRETVRN